MQQPGVLPRQARSADAEEQRGRRPAPRRQHRPRPHQVGIQRRPRVAADRHDALLAALAEQAHDVGGAVLAEQVVDVERDRLRDARARRVEQLEQRLVAQVGGLVAVGRREQLLDLLDRQRLRQPRRLLRRDQVDGRVGREQPLVDEKPVNPRIDEIVRATDDAASGCGRVRADPRTYAASAVGFERRARARAAPRRSRRYAATVLRRAPLLDGDVPQVAVELPRELSDRHAASGMREQRDEQDGVADPPGERGLQRLVER